MTSHPVESIFAESYLNKADQVFLNPGSRYSWEQVVRGTPVLTADGSTTRKISAVGGNTFRGFHKIDQDQPGAAQAFRDYFINEMDRLLNSISRVQTRHDLHQLQNRIRSQILERLKNVKSHQIQSSYNKVRKPIDLYFMNLIGLAIEVTDAIRARIVPLHFVPLDSQIMGHNEIFTIDELRAYGLSRNSTYHDVATEGAYLALQDLLHVKALSIAAKHQRSFPPIYFDLVWNNRYRNWGSNIFEINPLSRKTCNSSW